MTDQVDDSAHDDDRELIHTGSRPYVVMDHQGGGWTAVPHGSLLPIEGSTFNHDWEEPFDSEDLVRLSNRLESTSRERRFTINGARALGNQLLIAADAAEYKRNQRWAEESIRAEDERAAQAAAGEPETTKTKISFRDLMENPDLMESLPEVPGVRLHTGLPLHDEGYYANPLFKPHTERDAKLIRRWAEEGETLSDALTRMVRKGRATGWLVQITQHGEYPSTFRITTRDDQVSFSDLVATVAPFSEEPLSTQEIWDAAKLDVEMGDQASTRGHHPQNADVRKGIASAQRRREQEGTDEG